MAPSTAVSARAANDRVSPSGSPGHFKREACASERGPPATSRCDDRSRFVGHRPQGGLEALKPAFDVGEILQQLQGLLSAQRRLARREHCDASAQDLKLVSAVHKPPDAIRTCVRHVDGERCRSCHVSSVRSVAWPPVGDLSASRTTSSRSGTQTLHQDSILLPGPKQLAGRSTCPAKSSAAPSGTTC